MNLGTSELIIILVILLVLFGGARLPKLARSLGQAQREFKDGIADGGEDKPEGSAGDKTDGADDADDADDKA